MHSFSEIFYFETLLYSFFPTINSLQNKHLAWLLVCQYQFSFSYQIQSL
ncbi:hypothetical protein X975_05842, partial [Stegodyphus mimosarum]